MQPPPRLDLGNPPQPKPSAPPPHFPPPSYREETAPATEGKKGSRILPTLVTLSAFGGLLVLAWFAYQEGKAPVAEEEIPVIKAEDEPYKRAPENPGGEEIPHVDREVYDSISGAKQPSLAKKPAAAEVNPADQPIDRAFLKQFGATGEEEIGGETKQEVVAFGEAPKMPQPLTDEEMQVKAPVLEPKPLPLAKAHEALPTPNTGGVAVPVIPAVEAAAPVEAVAEEGVAEAEEPALPPVPKEVVKKVEAVKKPQPTTAAKKETTKKAAPAAAPKKEATKKLPAKGVRVQLGAFRSEAEAEQQWKKISGRFKTALSGKSMMVQKVTLPEKGTMYRLQAGPVASREEARSLCKKLVDAGQGCFLAK